MTTCNEDDLNRKALSKRGRVVEEKIWKDRPTSIVRDSDTVSGSPKTTCEFKDECEKALRFECLYPAACEVRKFAILVVNRTAHTISRSKQFQDIVFYTRDISDTIDKAHLMSRLHHIAQSTDRFEKYLEALKMEEK